MGESKNSFFSNANETFMQQQCTCILSMVFIKLLKSQLCFFEGAYWLGKKYCLKSVFDNIHTEQKAVFRL